jgi:hypothetical protein
MVSAEGLLVSTCFVMYSYHHLLVNNRYKTSIYTALQNGNLIYYLTIIVNKRRLTVPYGGRNCKAALTASWYFKQL